MIAKRRCYARRGCAAVPALTAMIVWSAASHCSAARVYQLANYPADQDGYLLSGTITTTDDAPLDSILETTEILDWQWSLAGPFPFFASRVHFVIDGTSASGVRISNSTIELPLASPQHPDLAELTLSRMTIPDGRGALGHTLSWSNRYDAVQGQITSYVARSQHGDVFRRYWGGPATGIVPPTWLIAIAVPEQTAINLAAAGVLTVMLSIGQRGRFSGGMN